jgi:DNA-binding SARP family transcriptional activator
VDFRILGPLEVRAADAAVAIPGARPRAVLAVLLLNANRAVSAEQLAQALWGDEAPTGAVNTVQVHMSRLRKALGDSEALVTTPAGYLLRVGPDELDAERFERRLAEGRDELAGGRPEAAAVTLDEALALWRGRPLDDLAYEPFAQHEIGRLEELRIAAVELRIEARLALGRHSEVVGELEALIAQHPYREGLRAQLMLALYRCDRQADALAAYQDARRALTDELGIEPGERLRELERAILAQDPELALPVAVPAASAPAAPAAPARRLVTVVCAGSAARTAGLDAEARHGQLDRFSAIVERHGGTVEAFTGDTLVGVFGKAAVREDDALRAAGAAIELRTAGLAVGVEAGEAFIGGDRRFATGEVFSAAARLQAGAPEGEIMLGESAHRLIRAAVRAERTDHAWRLVGLEAQEAAPTPFVGRARELAALDEAFADAVAARACRAVTVVGPAGIGKSRLAREALALLGGQAAFAVGRCPSYGEALAYRPVTEILAALGAADPLAGDTPAQPEELYWAVRRVLEHAAEERPLVVLVEDIHWAEPALLDLLDYLIAFVVAHPLLLVCLTRPELAETRPAWVSPGQGRAVIVLDALADDDAQRLVGRAGAVAAETAARIVATAEGNPLFLEQLVAVGEESGEPVLPTTIQAVLAARIDRLEPAERAVLEEASVQGRSFHVGALEDGPRASGRLVALVSRQMIRPERSALSGEDAFRFAHVLIREAAYRGLPKQRRAQLHEHVARWHAAQPAPDDATVGHHLAEAYGYGAELGAADHALAGEAAERLAAAADAALLRSDAATGARLLERAAALLDWYPEARAELLPALGAALFEARMIGAVRVLDEAVAAAPGTRLRARAQVERELVRLEIEPSAGTAPALAVADTALEALADDDYGQCRLWFLRGRIAWDAGTAAAADAAWERAVACAGQAGARREQFEFIGWRALMAALGPIPAHEAIPRCRAFGEVVADSPLATASVLNPLALLHATQGDFETADRLLGEAGAILRELGGRTAGVSHLEAAVRLLAGQPELAEAALRRDLEQLGEGSSLDTTRALLARAVAAQGRDEEAAALCRQAAAGAAPGDAATQAMWRGVAARILARAGRCDEAAALAREAVALMEPTDLLWQHGDAMLDLTAVLRTCGDTEAADRTEQAAHALQARKSGHSDRPGGS